MKGRARWSVVLLGAAVGIAVACIIPDEQIQIVISDLNNYPVRFVEAIPLDEAARCACSPSCQCPLPGVTGIPTYLDPQDPAYQFCICGDNKVDNGRLLGLEIYVEDQDEVDGAAGDSLYAAALLDWDPTSGDSPFDYVAYRGYLDPRRPLVLSYSSYESFVIKRPRPHVRQITLKDPETQRFDFCNGAGRPVGPGFHTLTLIVTDRMWFKREGEITLDGVPDIAAGATYDTRTYVFMCHEEGHANCDCADVSG